MWSDLLWDTVGVVLSLRLLAFAMSSWGCGLCVAMLLDSANSVERLAVGVLRSLRLLALAMSGKEGVSYNSMLLGFASSGKKRSTVIEDPSKMYFLKFDENV